MKRVYVFLSFFVAGMVGAVSPEVILTYPVETNLSEPSTKDTQKSWIDLISKAKMTLDIEQFYVSDQKGEALEPVLEEVRKAAKRGVKVRLLVDKKMFATYPDRVKELGSLTNITAKTVDFDKIAGGVQHAKFLVADGLDMYVGSANFDWRALSHIHEIGLRLQDATLGKKLLGVFNKDWGKGVTEKSETNFWGGGFELVGGPQSFLPANIEWFFDYLTDRIGSAKKSLKIQLYEYSTKVYGSSETWFELQEMLIKAAKRGVQVELMLDASKVAAAKGDMEALLKVPNIKIHSVKIPDYSKGKIEYARLIHSKYLLVDGAEYWVGTDNWSKGYFYHSRGVGIVGDDTATLTTLNRIYDQVKSSPYASLLK